MPSKAEVPASGLSLGATAYLGLPPMLPEPHSWTDDLPVCRLSGVGLSTNQIYREDGQRCEEHEFEDRCFRFRVEPDTYLYGLFDGHDGTRASEYALQRLPAEILLGQLIGRSTDDEIYEVLSQAFVTVEKGFFQSIDDLLAEKANLQMELPDNVSPYVLYQAYPDLLAKIQQIDRKIAGGTTAVVALIHENRLFVANVGDSRALLCRHDLHSNRLQVTQLSVDHDTRNEDELLRLYQLGLDIEKVRSLSKLGNQENTRCLGNYAIKGGYKDFDTLCDACSEPITSEPDICGGIPLNDDSLSFLLLLSDGLYRSLEEATGTEHVNQDIAEMVLEQFSIQTTLTGVAQAVVDRVIRIHHDTYMRSSEFGISYRKRDDITLLVRNFGQCLSNAVNSPSGSSRHVPSIVPSPVPVFVPTETNGPVNSNMQDHFPRIGGSALPSLLTPLNIDTSPYGPNVNNQDGIVLVTTEAYWIPPSRSVDSVAPTTTNSSSDPSTSQSNDSSSKTDGPSFSLRQPPSLQLDEDRRIEAYVDFSDFYRIVQEEHAEMLLDVDLFNHREGT